METTAANERKDLQVINDLVILIYEDVRKKVCKRKRKSKNERKKEICLPLTLDMT